MLKKVNQFILMISIAVFAVACGANDKGESSENNNSEETGEKEESSDNVTTGTHKNEVVEVNKSAEIYAPSGGTAKLTVKSVTMDFFPEGKTVLANEDEEFIRFDLEVTNEGEKDFDFNFTTLRINTPDEKDKLMTLVINKSNVDDVIIDQKTLKKGESLTGAMYYALKKGTKREEVSLFISGYNDKAEKKEVEIFLKDE